MGSVVDAMKPTTGSVSMGSALITKSRAVDLDSFVDRGMTTAVAFLNIFILDALMALAVAVSIIQFVYATMLKLGTGSIVSAVVALKATRAVSMVPVIDTLNTAARCNLRLR